MKLCPRWFRDEDSWSKALGNAASTKTTTTLLIHTNVEEQRKELSQTEVRYRDGNNTSREDKDKDSKNRRKAKHMARSSFASEKYGGGGKEASCRDRGY